MSTMDHARGGAAIEVVAKATRRRFTLEYKRKILREAKRCETPGAVGALLRREGLYSSHLTPWRAARDRGDLGNGIVKKRGRLLHAFPILATSGLPSWNAQPRSGGNERSARKHWSTSKKHRGVAGNGRDHRALLIATVTNLGPRLGIAATCNALGMARATYYRRRRSQSAPPRRRSSPRALTDAERMAVVAVLHEPGFVDLAPAEVYATLLDEGHYLCSVRTMYRMLAAHREVRERRDQLRHPHYATPELLACRPNELWSWDITKLLGPASLGLLTPADVHHGHTEQRLSARAAVRAAAYAVHPKRFTAGPPQPLRRPKAVWINPPKVTPSVPTVPPPPPSPLAHGAVFA
jgi:putative transposase